MQDWKIQDWKRNLTRNTNDRIEILVVGSKNACSLFRNRLRNGRLMSSKSLIFCTNGKEVCNFLLVIIETVVLSCHCRFSAENRSHPYSTRVLGCFLWTRLPTGAVLRWGRGYLLPPDSPVSSQIQKRADRSDVISEAPAPLGELTALPQFP